LCVRSAECRFSDANVALILMAAFSAMKLRLRLVYNLTLTVQVFLCSLTIFSYFHSILILREYSRSGQVLEFNVAYITQRQRIQWAWHDAVLYYVYCLHSQCSQIVTLDGLNNYEYWTPWFRRNFGDFFSPWLSYSSRLLITSSDMAPMTQKWLRMPLSNCSRVFNLGLIDWNVIRRKSAWQIH